MECFTPIDAENESILRIDPQSGTPSVLVTRKDLDPQGLSPAISGQVDLEQGLVADREGQLYAFSVSDPDTLFRIDIGSGEITTLVSGPPLIDPHGFATRTPKGDLIVADDGGFPSQPDRLFRITTSGADIGVFLIEEEIERVARADINLEGGMAFDSRGNFFIVEKKVRAHSAV